MMLCFEPPWIAPTVTTAGSCGSTSRLTQSLERADDPRGEHDRVLGHVRIGAVAADALHDDIDRIDVGEREARLHPDHPRGQAGAVVEGERVIGLGEAGEQPVLKHRDRALADLLGGLGDHDERAVPLRLHRREVAQRADPGRHVGVVAAGVHHAALDPVVGGDADLRGEGEAGVFGDGGARPCLRGSAAPGPRPLRSTATTPVPPTPSVTS